MPNYLVELTDGRKFKVDADSPPTEADLQQYMGQSALAQQPQRETPGYLSQSETPKEEPLIDISDTLKAAGQAIGGITTTAPHAFRQLYSGLDNPWQRSEGYKASQAGLDRYQQELEAANQAAVESGDISTASRGMRKAGQSLGFSAGAWGAGLVGSTATGAAYGHIGRNLGAIAGPEGAIAGEAIARGAGAIAAGYGAAYLMAGAQFLDDARKEIDAKFQDKLGRLPNEQEQKEAYDELFPLAQAFGHAEAGPEAIGNLAMARAGKFILGLGVNNIKGLAANALKKVGAGAGALTTELGGETATQVEQKRIDAQKNAWLNGQAPPNLGDRTVEEYKTALGEVAPATLATMGLIGSVPATYKAVTTLKSIIKPSEPAPVQEATATAVEGLGEAEAAGAPVTATATALREIEGLSDLQSGLTELPEPDLNADAFAGIQPRQNEQPITPTTGNLVPADGTGAPTDIPTWMRERDAAQSEADGGGVSSQAPTQEIGQASSQNVAGESEGVLRNRAQIAQAAAQNKGQIPATPIPSVFPQQTPQNNAVQEKALINQYSASLLANEKIQSNILSEGAENVPTIQGQEKENHPIPHRAREVDAASAWLQALEGNNSKEIKNAENALLGESETGLKPREGILANNDNGRVSLRAPSHYGAAIGKEAGEVGARSPHQQQSSRQQVGEPSIDEQSRAWIASWKRENDARIVGEIDKIEKIAGREMVGALRQLYKLPSTQSQARSAGIVRKLLDKIPENKKNQITQVLKEIAYARKIISSIALGQFPSRKESARTQGGEGVGPIHKGQEIAGKGQGQEEVIRPTTHRLFEGGSPIRRTGEGVFIANDPNSAFRLTGTPQIEDMVNSGVVRSKAGKIKGGREGEVHWSRGHESLGYAPREGSYLLQTPSANLHQRQNGLPLSEVAVHQFQNGQWVNVTDQIRQASQQQLQLSPAPTQETPSSPAGAVPGLSVPSTAKVSKVSKSVFPAQHGSAYQVSFEDGSVGFIANKKQLVPTADASIMTPRPDDYIEDSLGKNDNISVIVDGTSDEGTGMAVHDLPKIILDSWDYSKAPLDNVKLALGLFYEKHKNIFQTSQYPRAIGTIALSVNYPAGSGKYAGKTLAVTIGDSIAIVDGKPIQTLGKVYISPNGEVLGINPLKVNGVMQAPFTITDATNKAVVIASDGLAKAIQSNPNGTIREWLNHPETQYKGELQDDVSVIDLRQAQNFPAATPTQETPSSPAAKLEKEGVVPASSSETEVGGRSNIPVETKETPQGEVSSADIESKALEILRQKRPNWKEPAIQKAKKYFASRNVADIQSLAQGARDAIIDSLHEADPEAKHAQLAEDAKYKEKLRAEAESNRKAEEAKAALQAKLTESRVSAINQTVESVAGRDKRLQWNAVSVNDGLEALERLHNSGQFPGLLNAFVGTTEQFVQQEKNNPDVNYQFLIAMIQHGKPLIDAQTGKEYPNVGEGYFMDSDGRSIQFTDKTAIAEIDRMLAEYHNVPPAVAASMRVLSHEGLGHRGWWGLSDEERATLTSIIKSIKGPEDFDRLVGLYPQFEDWRTNPNSESLLVQEFISKTIESLKTLPTSGPIRRLIEVLQEIWQKFFGKKEGTLSLKELRLLVQMLQAGAQAPKSDLVNGGKVNIKASRPSFANPINAELARAAERFRQMNERQAVETPEGLKELFNPNAEGSGTTHKLFETQAEATPQQIRSEIRSAYDRALVGEGSVQASLQKVFDEAKKAIPTLTERQFGEQVQNLYEDGSAFLVPADRGAEMLAAGEKWGVFDAAGQPASYAGFMPVEVKASVVPKPILDKQRTELQANNITGESVEYQGKPLTNSQGEVINPIWRTEEQYRPKEKLAGRFVKQVAESLENIADLPTEVLNDEYLTHISAEHNGSFQTLLIVQAGQYLRDKAAETSDPEEKQKLLNAADVATAFLRKGASQAGLDLNMIKQVQKDPRFAGMFAVDTIKTLKKEEQASVVNPNFTEGAVEGVQGLSNQAGDEASTDIEGDLNADKEESEIAAGEALLNPRQRTIWERMKDILRLRARIAKAKLIKAANFKASNAAGSQADIARFVQMSDKELAALDEKLSKEFDSLSNEFFGREKPKTGKKRTPSKEKPIDPAIARMVSIVATKLGGGTNLEAALAALMPETPSYKDQIVDDIVSGIVGRVNQSIKKPQKTGALTALTKQLKRILAENIKVEPAKATDESLGQKSLKAFGYVTSNEDTVNRAWNEARNKIRETLREANLVETNESIEDELNRLIGEIPKQLYSTPQARSVIREALEGTKFENSKDLLEDAEQAKAEALKKINDAVSKEDAVDPARWQRDQSYIINAFDAMVTDLQKAKDKVIQKTKGKLLTGGKMTELQRLLDKSREGWSWKQIFTLPKAGQIRRRADMLQKVKENEAFKDLTDEEKAALVDLLDQAWYDRKAEYFGNKLKKSPLVKLPFTTNQGAAKHLHDSTPELLKAFNDGTFNRDTFNAILAKKYGVKQIDQSAMDKAEKLAEELQDPELPSPVYAKKADELLKLIADTQNFNVAKMLNDFWVTSVLAGPRTWFDIGFAALNGLQRILVDGTALALKGDVKTPAEALKRFFGIMPQAFKEAAHFIKTGDVSLLVNSKDQFARFLGRGLQGGQHSSTSYQLSHWNKDKHAGAPAWQKTQGNILRGIGHFMQIVERLLTALDHINSTATKYAYMPIAIAQNSEKYKNARLPNAKELEQFRTQAKAYLLGGKEPMTVGERTVLNAWTRHFSDKFYSDWQDVVDGAAYAGSVSSGTLDPEGIVGQVYNWILAASSRATSASDEAKVKAKGLLNNSHIPKATAYTRYAFATLGQLAAYSVRNLLGFRFIRFSASKFNDSLTYIPGVGLLRLAENDNDHATKNQMIWNNQAFGVILSLAGYAIIKSMADEDDPEKRGFDLEGSWDGIGANEKKQRSDAGSKEYTVTIYRNGKPIRLVYKNWPISAALSAIGTLTDMVKYNRKKWDEKEFADRLIAAAAIATTSTLDAASMSQFAELIGKGVNNSDPDEAFVKKITRAGTNFAGGFIPRIFKDLDYWLIDDNARKYDTIWQNFGKEVPVWRSHIGAPKLDIFSEPVRTSRSPWSRAIVSQPEDAAYRTLGLLNSRDIWLTPSNGELRTVGTKNHRRPLTSEEQDRYVKLVGAGYKEVVEKYGNRVLAMPKERAKAFIADKTREVRDKAEKRAVRHLTNS